MSNSTEAPLSVTWKADGSAPMLTVRADEPADLLRRIRAVDGELLTAAGETGAHFTAAYRVSNGLTDPGAAQTAPAAPPAAQPAAQPQSAWGNTSPASPAPAPTGPQNGTPHPNGKTCAQLPDGGACNAIAIWKELDSKAGNHIRMWTCPNQQRRGDGHGTEMVWR